VIRARALPLLLALGAACAPTTPSPVAGGHPAAEEDDAPPGAPRQLLDAHNQLRARHCAPPLRWSRAVAEVAQRWADRLAGRGCPLEHSGGELGENLAAASSGALREPDVPRLWYSEVARYDFRRGGFSAQTGHFTQLVWRESARLGCGRAACPGLEVWVCNYDPPGNVEGQYAANVLPGRCR